ncbi:TPA: PTS sugar transporter subunit IIB [Clostridioides difficile]|uniref:PTS sugar transporter subunit IIB n=1 Tax=Clostridioides difficile TaxID=1496 RepID=UPI0009800592|nr:PTS sugar transporter subunit IIB [Clostridioides difficile]SJR57488.1 Lichenan-specific phosphotransferase enzyme IIB component [Clostridioides difficile]HBF0729514.1 PTS sugar transporter subunit IIB [Clostridioides difficile]HBF6041313.1 PTS sugar transporter subunit IIB [Clostridioides difficile]HBF7389205.1 PTS sugar transporter subunit IIB [Clostridioides difficile]HBG3351254.1 PTS sugar transporter subunit IIB [Clostridioides difficile]
MKRKVYLFCSFGMSTSLLADKMQKVADEHNLPIEVEAFPIAEIDKIVEEKNPDCILLGPQVKYMLKELKPKFEAQGKLIDIINEVDYGTMNGEKVLKLAIKLIKSKKA